MAKPPDKGNSTQPLSQSQVLAVSQQKPPPRVPKHDQSMWKGLVVGADEFAPAPAKRGSHARTWAIVGALGALAAGGGLYASGVFAGSSDPAKPASPNTVTPAPRATPVPAAISSAPGDAAAPLVAAPPDAAVPAGPTKADAISSVGPPLKPSKATAVTKKKKPAPTPPKKRAR